MTEWMRKLLLDSQEVRDAVVRVYGKEFLEMAIKRASDTRADRAMSQALNEGDGRYRP